MAEDEDVKRRGRPSDRLSRHQLEHAMRIVSFDIAKEGRIFRWRCRFNHSPDFYMYKYSQANMVHVWCIQCGATTHWSGIHYHAVDDVRQVMDNNSDVSSFCHVCGVEFDDDSEKAKCLRCGLHFCVGCGDPVAMVCAKCQGKR